MSALEADLPLPELPQEIEAIIGPDEPEGVNADPATYDVRLPHAATIARIRARLDRELREVDGVYRAQREQLDYWHDQESKRITDHIRRVDLMLHAYLYHEIANDPSKKPRKVRTLPGGVTVSAKAQQPEWRRNEDEILAWAQGSAPTFVEQRPHLKWLDMKKAVAVTPDGRAVLPDTGEIVPTVEVVQRPDKYTVEVKPVE